VLRLIVQNRFQASTNAFGLWKDYQYCPSQDPDAFISPEDLYHLNTSEATDSTNVPGQHDMVVSFPYKTNSGKLVIDWQNTGSSAKSNEEINCLVRDILHHLISGWMNSNILMQHVRTGKQMLQRRIHCFFCLSHMQTSVSMCPQEANIVRLA